MPIVAAMSLIFLLVVCASGSSQRTESGHPTASRIPAPSALKIDARQAERLQRVMAVDPKNWTIC